MSTHHSFLLLREFALLWTNSLIIIQVTNFLSYVRSDHSKDRTCNHNVRPRGCIIQGYKFSLRSADRSYFPVNSFSPFAFKISIIILLLVGVAFSSLLFFSDFLFSFLFSSSLLYSIIWEGVSPNCLQFSFNLSSLHFSLSLSYSSMFP